MSFLSYIYFVVVLVEPYMRKGEHCCHSAVAICWRYDGRFSLFWSSFWFLWAKVLSILMQCAGGRFINYSIGIYLYWYLGLRFNQVQRSILEYRSSLPSSESQLSDVKQFTVTIIFFLSKFDVNQIFSAVIYRHCFRRQSPEADLR